MKPPTSNSSWSLLHSFLVTLFFALQFSIFHHSWQRPSPLQELKFVVASFHVLSYPSSPACIDSSMLVPFFAANNQNTFCTVLMLLYYGPLFLPCMSRPPKRVWPHLPSLCLEFSLHLSLYLHVTAASSASHTPILACCRTPLRPMLLCLGPLLFGVGSSCSQSFHSQASAKKKRWLRGICTLEAQICWQLRILEWVSEKGVAPGIYTSCVPRGQLCSRLRISERVSEKRWTQESARRMSLEDTSLTRISLSPSLVHVTCQGDPKATRPTSDPANKPTRQQSSRSERQRGKKPTSHLAVTPKKAASQRPWFFKKKKHEVSKPRCCISTLVSALVSSVTW